MWHLTTSLKGRNVWRRNSKPWRFRNQCTRSHTFNYEYAVEIRGFEEKRFVERLLTSIIASAQGRPNGLLKGLTKALCRHPSSQPICFSCNSSWSVWLLSTLVRLFLGNTSGQASDNVQSLWFCGAPSQFWNGSYCAAFIVFTAQEHVDQYLHVLAHQEGRFQVHKDQLSDCRAYPCEYTVMTLISQLSPDYRKTKCKKKRQAGTFWVVW